MELPERGEVLQWIGRPVLDVHGESVGTCRHVYADDATGASEWLVVELEGRAAFVPLTDARSADGNVHVPFSRSAIASSPDLGDSGELSSKQDVVLYEHYGVPYSRAASPSVLPTAGPAEVDAAGRQDGLDQPEAAVPVASEPPVPPVVAPPVAVTPTPAAPPRPTSLPRPTPPVRPAPPASRAAEVEPLLLGGLALTTAVLAVSRVLRGRRSETTGEKVVRRARERGTRLAEASDVGRQELARGAAAAARDLAVRRKKAAKAAAARRKHLARATTASTKRTRSQAEGLTRGATSAAGGITSALTATASRTAQEARDLGGTVLSAPGAVTSGARELSGRRVKKVRRSARRTTRRLALALGLASGYVVGAHAGRERYEQLVQLAGSPRVQQARSRLTGLAARPRR